MSDPHLPPEASSEGLHIALLFPEIHWNTGNAGRTCLAVGGQLHLVKPLGFSLEDRYLQRAGLDYWPSVQPRLWDRWQDLEAALPQLGQPVLVTPEALTPYWRRTYEPRTVFLFGSEGKGLPPELRQAYSSCAVSIPMAPGPVRSLNLSTSVALVAYEFRRQQAVNLRP